MIHACSFIKIWQIRLRLSNASHVYLKLTGGKNMCLCQMWFNMCHNPILIGHGTIFIVTYPFCEFLNNFPCNLVWIRYSKAYYLRGLLQHGMGDHRYVLITNSII